MDTLMQAKIEEMAAIDKAMAAEINVFMAGTLKISPQNPDFIKVEEGVSAKEPRYGYFMLILDSRGSNADPMKVEIMKKRVENHIRLRNIMLSP